MLYALISAVVELTALVAAGSLSVTVVPTAVGPTSTILIKLSKLLPMNVAEPAEPAVSLYCGISVCNSVTSVSTAT